VSGLLYAAPMPRVERTFERIDAVLGVDDLAAATPAWIAGLLEVAYLAVYPAVPAALAIRFLTTADPDPERFWSVILIADFICFGFLPWVQTRPPRALRVRDPWRTRLRHVNLQLLDRTSIQGNTFPSGHAAEALAAALLVIHAPPAFAVSMAFVAVLISAGTVLGRYHYAADAAAGWMVAAGVWMVLR
jgi:membrane-associated phospholipid phosphatase